MASKKKVKKVSVKKERYAKYHREKPSVLNISMPDLDDEQTKQKRVDETKIDKFLRFNRNAPSKEIVQRRVESKRAKIKR